MLVGRSIADNVSETAANQSRHGEDAAQVTLVAGSYRMRGLFIFQTPFKMVC